jgi:DNA invertase Pin-like site-specific DNA recombinase
MLRLSEQVRECLRHADDCAERAKRELVRNILVALLSSLAKLETQKISDRTKAGMARAKANGVKIGRPKLGIEIRQKIAQRAKKGETPYAIAKALGIDRHTAAKYAQLRA